MWSEPRYFYRDIAKYCRRLIKRERERERTRTRTSSSLRLPRETFIYSNVSASVVQFMCPAIFVSHFFCCCSASSCRTIVIIDISATYPTSEALLAVVLKWPPQIELLLFECGGARPAKRFKFAERFLDTKDSSFVGKSPTNKRKTSLRHRSFASRIAESTHRRAIRIDLPMFERA